jgi:hypothetical protein
MLPCYTHRIRCRRGSSSCFLRSSVPVAAKVWVRPSQDVGKLCQIYGKFLQNAKRHLFFLLADPGKMGLRQRPVFSATARRGWSPSSRSANALSLTRRVATAASVGSDCHRPRSLMSIWNRNLVLDSTYWIQMKSGEIDTAPGALQWGPCEVHGDLRHRLEDHIIQSLDDKTSADRDRLRQKSSAAVAPAGMVEVAGPGHSTKDAKVEWRQEPFWVFRRHGRHCDTKAKDGGGKDVGSYIVHLVGSEQRLAAALEKTCFRMRGKGDCIVLISC